MPPDPRPLAGIGVPAPRDAPAPEPRTMHVNDDGTIGTIDQTRLPFEHVTLTLSTLADCARAIESMQVRGAPLIGAVGAFGLAMALREDPADRGLADALERLAVTRPTAVNLRWALQRVQAHVRPLAPAARAGAAWRKACEIADEDVRNNRLIGEFGAALLHRVAERRAAEGAAVTRERPLQVLTHCNAGALATVALGTALAPVYALHAAGMPLHVWVDETRPRNQGAALTAWELTQAGVPCTVIADNAGGQLMRERRVDAVIVGCDRVARNGDVANKVGTYLKALAAQDCGVPFYVACPTATLDLSLRDGSAIPIEARSPREVTHVGGRDARGRVVEVQLTPDGVGALNPAFDVTPARLVTALITECGVCDASEESIATLIGATGG